MPTGDDPLEANGNDDHSSSSNSEPSLSLTTAEAQELPRQSVSHNSSRTTTTVNRPRSDLEETFDEILDDDDDEQTNNSESQRLLSTTTRPSPESSSLNNTTPPQQNNNNNTRNVNRSAIIPVTNDGVFSNISAKPDAEGNKLEETPPVSYSEKMLKTI